MPAFSVGDLIILCVVLLIIVLFRALDRNNRSLEKLKRFSDKMTENLSAVVEDKTRQLKELSTAFAADLRTGKDLLERVQAADLGLEGKSQTFDAIQSRLADYDRTLGELISMSGRVDENLKRIREEAGFVDGVGKRLKESSAQIERLEKEIPALDEKLKAAGRQALREILARIAAMEKGLPGMEEKLLADGRKRLDAAAGEIAGSLEGRARGLRGDLEASEKKVKDFGTYVARIEARFTAAEGERIAGLKKAMESFEAELKGKRSSLIVETKAAMESLVQEAETRLAGQREQLQESARQGETLEGEVFARLRETIEKDEAAMTAAIQKIEARFQDYETDIEYRFKKLEETGVDIGAMEKSLRQSIEKTAGETREAMKELSERLSGEWKTEIAAVQSEKLKLTAGMSELAEGLSGLKSSAYQDVSEKLQVFEDEFFADLRVRSSAMQEKIQAWQSEVDARTSETAQRHAVDREKLEKAYQEEVKTSLEKLRKTSGEEISRVESRVSDMEIGARERIAAAEEALGGLRETLRVEIERTRKDFAASFERELAAARSAAESTTKKMQRDIEQGIAELTAGLDAGRKELAESMGAAQTDVSSWKAAVHKSMSETESAIMKKIAAAAFDAENAIGNIRDVFASEKEEVLVSSNEERMTVKSDISGLSERISKLRAELEHTTASAVEALHKELEVFQLESQKRVREAQSDVESRIRDLKVLVGESREKTEAMQEKMFGKIEEDSKFLSMNLGEIDKRVKLFASQTKIFERADSLRVTLETGIEDMKKEISKVGSEKAQLSDLEAQLAKTRRMAEEISAKLGKFLSEKRRIEEMDGEFKKILTMSKDVDVKIEALTSHSDTLQQIQAKMRQFEEMGREVENGFERLEKKQEIVAVTSEGVDRNFQRLESMEKLLGTAGKEAETLTLKVNTLRAELETMAMSKKDAEAVSQIAGRLDEVLTDLESRFDKAQNAREWLARTETRFEEIGRQAQEQVRLLESIIKTENKREKGDRGAPPMDKRETVIKLSHQGWSVQEISRVTQLSRGEVELILELAPKV